VSVIGKKFGLERVWPDDPVAKYFKIEGFKGTVAVISSISEPFCDKCNRLRITADGKFKVCLNSPMEVELRNDMSDEDLVRIIKEELMRKPKEHGGVGKMIGNGNRPMIHIGG
jgi:GTP 3',8-cyclase